MSNDDVSRRPLRLLNAGSANFGEGVQGSAKKQSKAATEKRLKARKKPDEYSAGTRDPKTGKARTDDIKSSGSGGDNRKRDSDGKFA